MVNILLFLDLKCWVISCLSLLLQQYSVRGSAADILQPHAQLLSVSSKPVLSWPLLSRPGQVVSVTEADPTNIYPNYVPPSRPRHLGLFLDVSSVFPPTSSISNAKIRYSE